MKEDETDRRSIAEKRRKMETCQDGEEYLFVNGKLSDLSGRLGMASARDALRTGRLSVAWRYLEVPGCA